MLRSVIILCILAVSDCARILAVFPTPSVSHQVAFRPLTQELARRGHEVVVITTDPAFPKGQAPKNLTEIDVHDLSYTMWRDFMTMSKGNKEDLTSQVQIVLDLCREIFLKQLATDEVKKIIQSKNDTFDLLLLEAFVRPTLLLTHLFKAPTIQVSSFGGFFENFESVGAPIHPLFYPLCSRQKLNNLTLWERISELYNYYHLKNMHRSLEEVENKAIRDSFGDDVPPLSELQKNVDMLFLNVHPIWESNRPVPPSVVFMGGVHQKPKRELPKELNSYLSSSKHGVIYVSFGTNVNPSLLPPQKIQAMVDAFSNLPYDILWKWDLDELPGRTKNIRISKWLPQFDLLRHPKIKLFITQAGLQSTDEAILAGVPLIGIPMLGDQWYNAEKYVQLGLGLNLDMEALTNKVLKDAIETVINVESYRRSVEKFRSIMYDQKEKPLDRVVWWTEHVLRHGGAGHLRSPTANMPWAKFLQLDVVFVMLSGVLVVISSAGLALYFVYVKVMKLMMRLRKVKES